MNAALPVAKRNLGCPDGNGRLAMEDCSQLCTDWCSLAMGSGADKYLHQTEAILLLLWIPNIHLTGRY